MRRELTFACGNYDRTQGLIDGTIKPEGLELNWLTMPHDEMWSRMLYYYEFDYEFDASEMSFHLTLLPGPPANRCWRFPYFPRARFAIHTFLLTPRAVSKSREI